MSYLPPKLQSILQRKRVLSSNMGKSGNDYGKAIEEYCESLLTDVNLLESFNKHAQPTSPDEDYYYFYHIVSKDLCSGHGALTSIKATRNIPQTNRGGRPKTDVSVTYTYEDGFTQRLKYSSKHSTVKLVAGGQFRFDDMLDSCNIKDDRIQQLWYKFQEDGSAIMFSQDDKDYMRQYMANIGDDIWRFVLSGSTEPDCNDVRIANRILKFKSDKRTGRLLNFEIHTIDSYIHKYKHNSRSTRGFGTGVSFTRASSSNGKNIQVKIPT